MHPLFPLFLLASASARASFVEPIVTFEESDARVQCSPSHAPADGALACAGLENCQKSESWWTVAGKDYHGGRMVVTDSQAACRVEFQGTSITFYALRIEHGANGTYAIDGGARAPFTWGITNPRLGGGVTSLFRASGLAFGRHVLEFSVDAAKGALASVDFFAVTDPSLEKDVPQPSRPASFEVPASKPTVPAAPRPPASENADAIPDSHAHNAFTSPELEHTPSSPSSPSPNSDSKSCSPLLTTAASLLAVLLGAGALFLLSRRVRRLVRRLGARRGAHRHEDEDGDDDDKTVVFDMQQEEGKPLLKEDA